MDTIKSKSTLTESQPAPHKPSRKIGHRLTRALWVMVFSMVIGLLGLVLGMNVTYASILLPNTTVGGVTVGGLNKEAALRQVENVLTDRQELTILVGDEKLTAEAIDVGISYDVQKAVNEAFLRGKHGSVWQQMYELVTSVKQTKEYSIAPVINEESLNAFINDQVAGKIIEPVNASLAVNSSSVTVVADKPGTAIDLVALKNDIQQAVSSNRQVVVRANVKEVPADITKESLVAYQAQIQALVSTPVTIITEDSSSLPTTFADRAQWYTVVTADEKLQISVNAKAVAATVAKLAKKYDQVMVKEQRNANGDLLGEGRDGKQLNQTQTVATLQSELAALISTANQQQPLAEKQITANIIRTPKEQIVVTAASAGVAPAIDTEAKFIQINLATQTMYLFENRQLVNTFRISSGKAGMETPRGVHSIVNKARRPFSKIYGLYLPYWNAISADGRFGIHELPEWPGGYKEGESHLGRPVSHGCVRLGVGAAQYVYEWAPIGTAVVVQ